MGDDAAPVPPPPPPLRRKEHHRPAHFVVLIVNILVAVLCFAGSLALVVGQQIVNDTQKTAALEDPPSTTSAPRTTDDEPGPDDTTIDTDGPDDSGGPATTEPFPAADPEAKNFLLTGADSGACDDPGTPNPVGERGSGGGSDTIMVMRVDPSTDRAALLSFPRDLWVRIDGSNGKGRINSAYRKNDPQKLANTIYINFGVRIDHYIQIDFCAFKTLVDAVDGVAVPFEYPARDPNTNLNVPEAGCYTFDGAAALAYVRSRHYQYLDPKTGRYREDPASDYGRISRQQDFLRRAIAKVVSQGFDLEVARGLIKVATDYVVTDPEMTIERQLEFAGVLRNLDPVDIQTYQVDGVGTVKGGAAVIEPRLDTDNMKAILAIFRGEAPLVTAPDQVFEPDTSTPDATTTTEGGSPTSTPGTVDTVDTTDTTSPAAPATEVVRGIHPPEDQIC